MRSTALLTLVLTLACNPAPGGDDLGDGGGDADVDADTDSDTDCDSDSDADTDTDTDSDTDTDADTDTDTDPSTDCLPNWVWDGAECVYEVSTGGGTTLAETIPEVNHGFGGASDATDSWVYTAGRFREADFTLTTTSFTASSLGQGTYLFRLAFDGTPDIFTTSESTGQIQTVDLDAVDGHVMQSVWHVADATVAPGTSAKMTPSAPDDGRRSYIVKYDGDLVPRWTLVPQNTDFLEQAPHVGLRADGSSCVAGNYREAFSLVGPMGTQIFPDTTAGTTDYFGSYLSTYDVDGNVGWDIAFGDGDAGGEFETHGVVALEDGGCLVVMHTLQDQEIITGDASTAVPAAPSGGWTTVLARFAGDGSLTWHRTAPTCNLCGPYDLSVGAGRVAATGNARFTDLVVNSGESDELTIPARDTSTFTSWYAWTAAWDLDGNVLWGRSHDATGGVGFYEVSVAEDGAVYFGGDFYGDLTTNTGGTATSTRTVTDAVFHGVVMRQAPDGDVEWVRTFDVANASTDGEGGIDGLTAIPGGGAFATGWLNHDTTLSVGLSDETVVSPYGTAGGYEAPLWWLER